MIVSSEAVAARDFVDADNIVSKRPEKFDGPGRYVHIGQESHPITEVFSLATQAPYLAAWYTSSFSNSG